MWVKLAQNVICWLSLLLIALATEYLLHTAIWPHHIADAPWRTLAETSRTARINKPRRGWWWWWHCYSRRPTSRGIRCRNPKLSLPQISIWQHLTHIYVLFVAEKNPSNALQLKCDCCLHYVHKNCTNLYGDDLDDIITHNRNWSCISCSTLSRYCYWPWRKFFQWNLSPVQNQQ